MTILKAILTAIYINIYYAFFLAILNYYDKYHLIFWKLFFSTYKTHNIVVLYIFYNYFIIQIKFGFVVSYEL